MKWILYTLLIEAACISCGPKGPDLPLIGTRWTMDMAEKVEVKFRDSTSAIHFTLHPDTSLVDGRSGCNTFTGIYTHGADSLLLFENLVASHLLCRDLDFEIRFFRSLDSTRSYVIKRDILTLKDRRGRKLATFHATPLDSLQQPPRP